VLKPVVENLGLEGREIIELYRVPAAYSPLFFTLLMSALSKQGLTPARIATATAPTTSRLELKELPAGGGG